MSWVYTHQSNVPYVESYHSPASLPTTPAQNSAQNWTTPSTQPGLTSTSAIYADQEGTRARIHSRQAQKAQTKGLGLHVSPYAAASSTSVYSTQGQPTSTRPPKRPSVASTTYQTPYTHTHHVPQATRSASLYTPPLSVEQFPLSAQSHSQINMTQRRTPSQGHRPLMGPPETPSRGTIPQSPGLFPNIQFSPDLFSQQMMDSQSAPVYPQQRLFWDPATATPLQGTPQHFHTPIAYPDDFNTSFNSSSTIVPLNYAPTPQETTYDLPTTSEPMHSSFLDVPNFPTQAAFHTSPRPPLPAVENPTQFLSSPARRFGGDTQLETSTRWQQTRDLPAYHHQLQESKREQEMLARQRRKSRTQKRPAEEDLVMKSVRRALSPSKVSRPAVIRSNTLAGNPPALRRSSSTIDNISITSSISSRSNRAGRSSPLRQVNDNVRRVSTPAVLRPSSSMSLEIDRNGVARTILAELPERTSEDMEEGYSTEELSSEDEMDHQMLYSFDGNSQLDNDSISRGDARDELRSNVYLSMGMDKFAQISRDPIIDPRVGLNSSMSTIKSARGETLTSSNNDNANPTNAQQALRNLMQDRSRSASSHASTSSMQFHSSPPLQQGHLPRYNASPTTANDAELATPSTDVDSIGSSGQTRCVCNSASAEGNLMLQCDSCSKWLHARCVGLTNKNIPDLFICPFCERTPIRGSRMRGTLRQASFHQSPLAHKSSRHH